MVKKKAKISDGNSDYEAIGRRIVDAVKAPIINGTYYTLGLDSLSAVRSAKYWSGDGYKRDYKLALNQLKIASIALDLKQEIELYAENNGINTGNLIDMTEKIRIDFTESAQFLIGAGSGKENDTFNQWVHTILSDIFFRFFGLQSKQTYNHQEEKYEGPFAEYIRVINQISGAEIKNGTIAKIESRRAKKKPLK